MAVSKAALKQVSRKCDIVPRWNKRPAANPPSLAQAGSCYVYRRFQYAGAASSGNTSVTVTLGQLASALGPNFGTSAEFKIKKISIWNTRLGGALNAVVSLPPISSANDANIAASDYGSGTALAAVELHLPDVIATTIPVGSSSTTTVLTLTDSNAASGISSNYCVQFTAAISV